MKALLLNVKKYKIEITGLATKPEGISPEEVKEKTQEVKDAILAFITLEDGDTKGKAIQLKEDLLKMASQTKRERVIICPFAHLSNNLASSNLSLEILNELHNILKEEIETHRTHFGSDKSLLLDIPGHIGNIRFREF
jgi:threonyl-tRNA synthetase